MKTRLLAASLLFAPSFALFADEVVPPPLLEFASGLPGKQVRLTWPAEAGLRYRIERSTTLQNDGPGGWKQIALVEATGDEAEWLDPESTGAKAFYRVSHPLPEVFSIEPPLLSETGGEILLHGQRLYTSGRFALDIDGLGIVSVPLTDLGDGVWSAVFSGTFPSGARVLSATVTDAAGVALVAIDPQIVITATGRAEDGPASLPPAAPVPDFQSNPIPGVGIVVKRNRPKAKASARTSGGSDSWNPWDLDDSGDGAVMNPLYEDPGKSGTNPLYEASARAGAQDHNSSRSNKSASAQDHNSSRSNKSSSVVASGGPDDDCDGADSRPAPSGIPGEVSFRTRDLSLPCPAGPPLAWVCTYRSMAPVSSGHGPGWDFSYNISIEPIPASAGSAAPRLKIRDGGGRADIFHRQADGTYRCDGMFREGRFTGDAFTLTFADTGTWTFKPLDGSPAAGKIDAITDRNGVALSCAYDSSGQLETVSDGFGRRLAVEWGSSPPRILSVTSCDSASFTYAKITYTYADQDKRTSVSCPFVPGQPPVAGPTTYTYASGFADPRLNDNLLGITDGAGRLLEAFTYTSTAGPADIDYDTCISHDRHRIGGGGHVTVLKREEAPPGSVPGGGYTIFEVDEVGRLTETDCDRLHRVVRVREYTGFCTPGVPATSTTNRPDPATKLRATDPDFFETSCAYNADSLCTRITHPDGSQELVTYERDLKPGCPVRERGNPRVMTVAEPGGKATRTVSLSHLPGFGTPEAAKPGNPIGGLTIKGGRNPGGGMEGQHSAAPGNPIKGISVKGGQNPSKRATGTGQTTGHIADITLKSDPPSGRPTGKRIFEPMGSIGGGGMPNRISMNVTVPKQTQGKSFGERVVSPRDAASGLPTGKRQHKPLRAFDPGGSSGDEGMTTRDAGSGRATGRRQYSPLAPAFPTQIVTAHGQRFSFTYDGHGNLTGETTPIPGSGALYEYNALGQPVAATVLDGPDSSFREEIAYDPATAFPSSVTCDPGGLALVTAFTHDNLGRCVSVTDPLGHDWLFDYNPPGQCVAVHSPEIAPGVRVSTTATFDAGGRIARVDTDHLGPDGKPVAANPAYSDFYVYDSRARLVRVAEEERPVDASGVLVPDSLGLGNFAVLDISYDAAGQVTRLGTPAASRGQVADLACDFTWDERGLPHRIIEGGAGHPSAVVTETDYDALGAPVRIVSPGGQGVPAAATLIAYDGFHRLSSVTDPMGNATTFAYDNHGFVTTSVFGEIEDQPGSAGNVLLYRSVARERTAVLGFACTSGPDNKEDLRVVSPAGPSLHAYNQNNARSNHAKSLFFDVFAPDDTFTEERFNPGAPGAAVAETTVVHRSPAGLPLSVTRNGDGLLALGYDTAGRLVHVSGDGADSGCRMDLTLDAAGNAILCGRTDHFLVAGQPDQTFTRTFAYDALGRCVQAADGTGNTALAAYDSLGRCVALTEAGGLVVQAEYDGETAIGDPFSRRVVTDVDGDGAPEVLSTALVRCGELVHEEDSYGHRTSFTRDALGRVTRVDHPDDAFETVSYDSSGRPTGMRQKNGVLVGNGFDSLDRLVSISHNPASLPPGVLPVPPTALTYVGPCDAVCRVQQGGSVLEFSYDSLGNPLAETGDGFTITRTFDHRGSTSVSYSDGRSFAVTRNVHGLPLSISVLDAVGQPVSPPLVAYEYAGHRVWRSTLDNGTVTTFLYRGDGALPGGDDASFDALVRVTVRDAASNVLEDTVSRRDPDQRLLETATAFAGGQAPPGRILTLTRNALGHVTHALTRHREVSGGPMLQSEVSYTLDLEGRRLSVAGGANPGGYAQDPLGRYTVWPGGALEWDAESGLRLLSHGPAGQTAFAYDAENRLVSATDPADGSVLVSYTYDALGRRTGRTAADPLTGDSVTTAFAYDGDTCVREMTTGLDVRISDFGLSRLVTAGDGSVHHLHHRVEHWGDPHENLNGKHLKDWSAATLVTGADGAPLERFAYDDAGAPVFLDAGGRLRPVQAPVGPIRWMAPEALWEPGIRLYLGPDATYSPDLGTITSTQKPKKKPKDPPVIKSHEMTGHVTLMK